MRMMTSLSSGRKVPGSHACKWEICMRMSTVTFNGWRVIHGQPAELTF